MPHVSSPTVLIYVAVCIFIIFCTVNWSRPASYSEKVSSPAMTDMGNDYASEAQLKVREAFDAWHNCVSDVLAPELNNPERLWSVFRDTINRCHAQTPMKKINLTGIKNKDETKYHIFNNADKSPSTVITLGVGWDVKAEQKLKELLPNVSAVFIYLALTFSIQVRISAKHLNSSTLGTLSHFHHINDNIFSVFTLKPFYK
ncbi:hypothetical protein OESDEN_01694 [Oesophagostomum dentatum]|uniref:Uncharacterized protein n=1 Tax=Oesophagostomum dentatum TaxID=61180 RepID=A0A0B1TR65_OESDE|nr:hypothetical protein OESDEN_01694 [Oesophagostomum dentatum]